MAGKHLITADYMDEKFRPFKHLYSFPRTKDIKVWARWRKNIKKALRRILAINEFGPVPTPKLNVIRTDDRGLYVCHEIRYETMPGNLVRAFLLIPKKGPLKKPAVICPHGHVKGGAEGTVNPGFAMGVAYAHEIARQGLVALAPDNAGNGARDVPEGFSTRGCDIVWRRLNHIGLDLTGFRVLELITAVNILRAHGEVCPTKIGAAGLSGGCWLAQVLTALDDRIRAVVLSGYFCMLNPLILLCHQTASVLE